MVHNGLAQDREPGIKEPALFVNDDPHPARIYSSDLPLLDATVGYACNPDAIRRLPEHGTHIVVCVRNPLDRCWSDYKMLKLQGRGQLDENMKAYASSFSQNRPAQDLNRFLWSSGVPKIEARRYFPRRSAAFVDRYMDAENAHLQAHTFTERLEYEIGFFLTRRQLPFLSILAHSFYYYSLRLLLEKYQPSDVSVVSVSKLGDADLRREFVRDVFGRDEDTPAIPVLYSHEGVGLDEPKPDFNDSAFDSLRAFFRYDLEQARALIEKTRFGTRLIDVAKLNAFIN
jgi:hypothetical protein